jgi:hypothetical protein
MEMMKGRSDADMDQSSDRFLPQPERRREPQPWLVVRFLKVASPMVQLAERKDKPGECCKSHGTGI